MIPIRWGRTLSIAGILCGASLALAQEPPFYQGKTIQIVVGFDAGGGYDAYTRLIGRHMARYIPGNPTILVQNMPGAGSRVAANWLYNVAPRDGTVLGSLVQSTPVDQAFKEQGVRFDASKFAWIGNPIIDNLVSITSTQSGLATMDDVKAKGGLICGSSGAGPTVSFPNTIGKLLGTTVRIVAGYPGVNAVTLAMQRGEVNCNGGQAWSSMKATMAPLIAQGQLKAIVQWGAEPDPDISTTMGANVPMITAFARNDADRVALRLLSSTSALSRPLVAPPGLPPERIALLRDAFDRTMKDPDFLADAQHAHMDIKPASGKTIQTLVDAVVSSTPQDVEHAAQLVQ